MLETFSVTAPVSIPDEPAVRIEVASWPYSLHESVGPVLKVLRLAYGYSQAGVARRFGCPRTYISKVERGGVTPTLEMLIKFARVFKIPTSVLIQLITTAAGEV
jgi:DNA-binding XRE family transcriptional regulator